MQRLIDAEAALLGQESTVAPLAVAPPAGRNRPHRASESPVGGGVVVAAMAAQGQREECAPTCG